MTRIPILAAAIGLLLILKCGGSQQSRQQDTLSKSQNNDSLVMASITKESAIAIAKNDIMSFQRFRADDYNIDALEEGAVWKVTFRHKKLGPAISGGLADYFINKNTGEILKKVYYQ